MPDYPRRATTHPADHRGPSASPVPDYGHPASSPSARHPRHTASPKPDYVRYPTAGGESEFAHGAGSPTARRAHPTASSTAARPHAAGGLSGGYSGGDRAHPHSSAAAGRPSGAVPSYLRLGDGGEGEHELAPVPVTVLHGRWGDGRDLVPETAAESPVWPGDPFWRRDRDETEPGAVRRAAGGVGAWYRSSPLWLKVTTGAVAALVLVVGVSLALRDGGSPQQAAAVGSTTTTLGTTTTPPSTTTTSPPPSSAPALTPPSVVRTTTTTAPTTTVPPTTETPTTAPPTTEPPREYRNCWEALRAGALPLERGEPGYGPHLDDDGDGRACEWGEGQGRGSR